MTICGIIAEYNPLHNGHAYHMAQARRLSGCDALAVVMSGNFTQRGEPAIVDKWARTEMALAAGADLVLELPAGYALQTAQWFALGGVAVLAGLGCVTTLAFGAESDDTQGLSWLAGLLEDEPAALSQGIRRELAKGLPHPAARSAAVAAYCRDLGDEAGARRAEQLLASPNNILALLYIQALGALHTGIRPLLIRRAGSDYHETDMEGSLSSATAIRRAVFTGRDYAPGLPPASLRILEDRLGKAQGPVGWPGFERQLCYRLRTMAPQEAAALPDMAEGLDRRMLEAARRHTDMDGWLQAVKVRRYAQTRIQRAAAHALLQVSGQDVALYRREMPRYARVLGLRASARPLLSQLSRTATEPLITRPARYAPADEAHRRLWALDLRATDLYAAALAGDAARGGRDLCERLVLFKD